MGAELDVDETDLQILNLLYLGLADAAVGRRLGMGHRTVQRRVRDMMARLEAKSRVALGARAQELGLLNHSSRSAHSAFVRFADCPYRADRCRRVGLACSGLLLSGS